MHRASNLDQGQNDMKIDSLSVRSIDIAYLRWGSSEKKALLIHGFPDSAYSMEYLAQLMVADGYEVVAPFLPGYAPTDQLPDGQYDIVTLSDLILGFLDAMSWPKTHVIGHDWGAVIGYALGALHPERCARLIALSVPPFRALRQQFNGSTKQKWQSKYILWFQLPGLAEASMRRNDFEGIDRLWSRWSPDWNPPELYVNQAKECLRPPGALTAALSYYRHARPGLSQMRRDAQRLLLSPAHCPVICMVGERDACIQPEAFESLPYPNHVIPGAGHFLPLEAPDAIADILREG